MMPGIAKKCADCGHGTLYEKCIRCEWRERQAWIDHEKTREENDDKAG